MCLAQGHKAWTPVRLEPMALVYIVIDDETFQQTFVNKTTRGSLKISIHVFLDVVYLSSYIVFHRKSTFSEKHFI